MKNNSIRYLLAGFGLSLFLLLFSSAASYISINRLIGSTNLVNRSNVISLKLENIISNIKDAETGFRGYLLTHDSAFLAPYKGAYARTAQSLAEVKELTNQNPVQQKYVAQLEPVIKNRFRIFELGLKNNKNGAIDKAVLYRGKAEMDKARGLVTSLLAEEKRLLADQNERLQKYINYTPSLVVLAAILGFFITGIAFVRIRGDFRKQSGLQLLLEEKSTAIKERVALISEVAEKISAGNYAIRVDSVEEGDMGDLSRALNKMASDLETNFTKLEKQAWLQNGALQLNDQLKGEKSPQELSQEVLTEIIHYLQGHIGILYLVPENRNYLQPVAAYGYPLEPENKIKFGEGLVGQTALDLKPVILEKVPEDFFRVCSGLLNGAPATVIIFPLLLNNTLLGIIEIGSLQPLPEAALEYLQTVGANTAVALNTALIRLRVHELLQETQAQAEELQVQQDELQRSNVDLEMQTQKLQASEEELRVQQEELLQSNQELEEKAQLLEERNQYIENKSQELLQLNDDVAQKNQELEQASKYKSEFLANMSHELRTPLNSILLLAKLLSESQDLDLGDDRYEYAKVIHGSGMGLLELINEILDLSKIEAGQMQIYVEEVPFTQIKQDLTAMFTPLANEKGLELIMELDPELPEFLRSDKQRLEQILKNLLSNAIKFTEKGSVKLKIKEGTATSFKLDTETLQNGPVIAFSVQDSGIGIPLENQAMVFEAFKQVDGTSRRKFGGTGLGLSISREISKLLGGEITLSSQPDQGSLFTVYLPLIWQEEPVAPEITITEPVAVPAAKEVFVDAEEYISEIPDDRNNLSPADKAILIVEDDISFVKALIPFVKKKGFKILVANRGDAGLKLAQKYLPFGILLDINLPGMDGFTVMDHLKHDAATRHIPVHTMSSEEARQKSLSLGAIDFINKPLAQTQLDGILLKMQAVDEKHNRKLLVVEENPKHAAAISDYFQQQGIATATAMNGIAGLSRLQKENFDGVILDISSNEKTAYSLIDQIKTNKQFETLPIIVYTGNNITHEDESRINKYAATSIVKKASTFENILSEVSIFLHLVAEDKPENGKRKNKLLDRGLAGKSILLADDDERNIYSLSKVLELQGVQVIPVVTGLEVVNYLRDLPPLDAILMDMMMPEMDGYETMRYIRQVPTYKNTPIIAVTAKTMPNDRNKCMEAGASDYIAKPVDLDQLLSLLRVWLY